MFNYLPISCIFAKKDLPGTAKLSYEIAIIFIASKKYLFLVNVFAGTSKSSFACKIDTKEVHTHFDKYYFTN